MTDNFTDLIEKPTKLILAIITDWITNEYFIDSPVSAKHLRSVTNDVYLITSSNARYILKVYGLGWREESAIAWEVELLNHLSSKGANVAIAIKGRDGKAVKTLSVQGQQRSAVLFEYAPGDKPQEPFLPDLYYAEGKAVAQMHTAGDDFTSQHKRQVLDLAYLIDAPREDVASTVNKSDQEFLAEFGDHIKGQIIEANEQGLDWGPVHGDMTLDNLHVTNDGEIYFYDFDSGGMGWRASDIQGWAIRGDADTKKQEAFLKGYREIRDLSTQDVRVAPYVFAAWEIWGLSADFTKRIRTEVGLQKYLAEQMKRIRNHEQALKVWEKAKL